MVKSIAVIFHRLGPYHFARLRAAGAYGRVVAIEMSAEDLRYAWSKIEGVNGFERVTVFQDRDCDSVPGNVVAQRLERVLDGADVDAVAVPSWGTNYAIAALRWSLRRRKPNVVMSESAASDRPRRMLVERVKGGVVRNFQTGLLGGTRHAAYLQRLGMPADRCFFGYDVVDNEHFAAGSDAARRQIARGHLGLPQKYFISVSRFIAKKNVPVVLKAFARFRDAGGPAAREWHLVLLGDGPLRPRYVERVKELGLEGAVLMPGFKQYDELPAYYGLAGAFVLGSLEEQWGLVVNEAMAAGLPVLVSTHCGCSPDLIREGESGYTFDPLDAGDLAGLLARLAADPAERERMGHAARQAVSKWAPETFGRNLWRAARAAEALPRPRHTLASRILLSALSRRGNRSDE